MKSIKATLVVRMVGESCDTVDTLHDEGNILEPFNHSFRTMVHADNDSSFCGRISMELRFDGAKPGVRPGDRLAVTVRMRKRKGAKK